MKYHDGLREHEVAVYAVHAEAPKLVAPAAQVPPPAGAGVPLETREAPTKAVGGESGHERARLPHRVAEVPVSADDPMRGQFSLEDATKGLASNGPLVAEIKTSRGSLECELFPDKAPITVANFVGLARGLRPWKTPQGSWVRRPAYDGTTFHRVIKGFAIQGGDPSGTGQGSPGYVIPDELWEGARHDRRGMLCMANQGPNTNGMIFFILDGPAKHLDGKFTIFGKCGPDALVASLANVPTEGERASDPTKITRIVIRR